ncbi:MAG: DnaD domain protein [Dehalococcoidia bacterium]|jgi:DnaD/phage-associated family protein|nr:DnaD domain protein [Dehalococcoidia bacterium]
MGISGFPPGTLYTPVPNPVFGPLLEQVQDLAELKVTLRGLWLLHRARGRLQAVPLPEFLDDRTLLRGLQGPGKDPREEILRGLQLAVVRGTFLLHRPAEGTTDGQVYLLNTSAGRSALLRLRRDGGLPKGDGPSFPVYYPVYHEDSTETPAGEKPNIFGLYEDNVGTLSPLLADQLREAEEVYPWAWINEAFAIAVTENKRSWRYIAGILRRWAAEGKGNGKPGRHSQKDDRQKYVEDYERRWGRVPEERAGR